MLTEVASTALSHQIDQALWINEKLQILSAG